MAIGGGIGYFFWIASRPKKMTWKAYIYQLSDGVIPIRLDEKGQPLKDYKLSDLRPYTIDVAEKVDKKSGATHYWLQKLQKALPVVTADCVEVWGQKDKWIRVLLEGDTTTLLKAGYDRKLGMQIFRPMPHDRINMIKTEIEERRARIENTKDILAQITPFVVVGVSMLALVIVFYLGIQGAIEISENNVKGADMLGGEIDSYMKIFLEAKGCVLGGDSINITKEEPPTIPP